MFEGLLDCTKLFCAERRSLAEAGRALEKLGRIRGELERLEAETERRIRGVRAEGERRSGPLRCAATALERALAEYARQELGAGVAGEVDCGTGVLVVSRREELRPLPGLAWAEVVRRLRVMGLDDALAVREHVDAAVLNRLDCSALAEAGVERVQSLQCFLRPGPCRRSPPVAGGAAWRRRSSSPAGG